MLLQVLPESSIPCCIISDCLRAEDLKQIAMNWSSQLIKAFWRTAEPIIRLQDHIQMMESTIAAFEHGPEGSSRQRRKESAERQSQTVTLMLGLLEFLLNVVQELLSRPGCI